MLALSGADCMEQQKVSGRTVQEARIRAITDTLKYKVSETARTTATEVPHEVKRQLKNLQNFVSLFESELKKNVPSRVAHKEHTLTSMPDPSLWNTVCGWRFVHTRFTLHSELPPETKPYQRCSGHDVSEPMRDKGR
eukprot:1504955-Amphidinium_carterae.1